MLVNPDERLDIDTPLLNGSLDSSDLLRLATFIEESFQLALRTSDMSAAHFGTVRQLERFIVSERNAAAGS